MKFKHTILIITALASTACNKELPIPDTKVTDMVRFLPANDPMAESKAAITGTTFPPSRTLTVSAYYNAVEESPRNYFESSVFTSSSSVWESGRYWPQTGTLDFLAYSADGLAVSAAYDSKVTNAVTLTVPNNASTQCDILHGRNCAQTYNSAGNPLLMRHAQALITFKATSTEAYNSTTNKGITINSIYLNNAYYSGTCRILFTPDPINGYCIWSSLGNQTNKLNPSPASVNIGSGTTTVGSGILVPEQSATSFTVTYTLHNGKNAAETNHNKSFTETFNLSGNWEEGVKYIYTLSFQHGSVKLTATIDEWNKQNTNVNIEKPLIDGHDYIDLGLRNGDGDIIVIADRNIGADSITDVGLYYAWGEPSAREWTLSDNNRWALTSKWFINQSGYTPYCTNSSPQTLDTNDSYSKYNIADGKTILDPEDDTATRNWGPNWKMPTIEEVTLLFNESYTTASETNDYNGSGVPGLIINGKGAYASREIFMAAGGWIMGKETKAGRTIYQNGQYYDGSRIYGAFYTYEGNPGIAYWIKEKRADTNGAAGMIRFNLGQSDTPTVELYRTKYIGALVRGISIITED